MVVDGFLEVFEVAHGGGDVVVAEFLLDHFDVVAGGFVERPGEHVAQAVDGVFGGLLAGVEGGRRAVEAGRAGGVEVVAAQERGEDFVDGALRDVAVGRAGAGGVFVRVCVASGIPIG